MTIEPATEAPRQPALPADYGDLLTEVKSVITASRAQAARVVNTELIRMYWRIGRLILDRQEQQGYGAKVVDQLSVDLKVAYPDAKGFGRANLHSMRKLAEVFETEGALVQSPIGQVPWGHLIQLLALPATERDWYALRTVEDGWSQRLLAEHLRSGLYGRTGAGSNNFLDRLPDADAQAALELIQDPFSLDFLSLTPGFSERELEDGLVEKLTLFLQQLGKGFSYLGRQHRLEVDGDEFFLDLLFYHVKLHRYVVFELKVGKAQPEFIGKLNFYVQAVEMFERDHDVDQPTLGVLLVTDLNQLVMTMTLQGTDAPIAIGRYTYGAAPGVPAQELPAEIAAELPSMEQLHHVLTEERSEPVADEVS